MQNDIIKGCCLLAYDMMLKQGLSEISDYKCLYFIRFCKYDLKYQYVVQCKCYHPFKKNVKFANLTNCFSSPDCSEKKTSRQIVV